MGVRGWFERDLDDLLANPALAPAGQHGRCRKVTIDGPAGRSREKASR